MSAAPAPQKRPSDVWSVASEASIVHNPILEGSAGEANIRAVPEVDTGHARPAWLESLGRVLYRLFEMAFALSGLVLTFPVALWIAWIIKRDSPGPAVFRQARVAKGRGTFTFLKFRTLYADARERWPELYAYQYTREEIDNTPFKTDNDPRVTSVGAWLRRTTLDEIPNLYNLLSGDVTLVGPRPEIPEMLCYYTSEEMLKFSVKPGLTGLAQISGRNRLTMGQTIQCDLYYVRNRSFRLDMWILWETVKRVLARDGAF